MEDAKSQIVNVLGIAVNGKQKYNEISEICKKTTNFYDKKWRRRFGDKAKEQYFFDCGMRMLQSMKGKHIKIIRSS